MADLEKLSIIIDEIKTYLARLEKLSDLTIMRNNLAHRYERITKIKLVHTVKDMKEVKDFTEDIIKYFRK